MRFCLFFWFFKSCELIRDSSLWRSNFIPLVHDSVIIIGQGPLLIHLIHVSFINIGSGLYQNLNFSFQVFQYYFVGSQSMSIEVRIIIPPLFKRIHSQIVTYIKRRRIRNIKCSTNVILAWKIQLVYIVIDSCKDLKWTIPSRM